VGRVETPYLFIGQYLYQTSCLPSLRSWRRPPAQIGPGIGNRAPHSAQTRSFARFTLGHRLTSVYSLSIEVTIQAGALLRTSGVQAAGDEV
jgi:hypothetical protein